MKLYYKLLFGIPQREGLSLNQIDMVEAYFFLFFNLSYYKNVEIMTKYDMSELLVSKIKESKFGFS